jgi:PAS domain S-box-containing protein
MVGVSLIYVAAVRLAYQVWRQRETHLQDILALVGALALLQLVRFGPAPVLMKLCLLALQPLLILRLVDHFHPVPRALFWGGSAGVVIVGLGAIMALGTRSHVAYLFLMQAYAGVAVVYPGVALAREVGRTGGVSKRRMGYASAGTWIFLLLASFGALTSLSADFVSQAWLENSGTILRLLGSVMFVCYFLAFATPRRLAMRWQEVEQAKYLSATAEREPDRRGAQAADDLNAAALRSVSNSAAFVALRSAPGVEPVAVQAASLPVLAALPGDALDTLAGGVWRHGESAAVAVDACDPRLGDVLRPLGRSVLVAPVVAGDAVWGLLVVVQRRGSLFPEDDLRLLSAFGRYAGTALDHARLVNERRDREHRSSERRIREVESRMSLMLDNIKDYAMLILDDRGTVVTWQAGSQHVFGYSSPEITDEPAAPLFVMSPEAFLALLGEARQLGLARREGPCRRRDGSNFLGSTVIRPLEDEEGTGGFVVVTRDVTERRNLEDRLRQSQKMEAIGQLAGGIAHDFNNLLTAILGYSDWLARDIPVADSRHAQVAEIQKAAERAAGLTRQLLTFSRGQMLQPEVLNLARLVSEILPMLRRVIGEHIEVVGKTGAEVSPVLADRSQIEQVVLNLAVNARDAMARGGRLQITTDRVWLDDTFAAHEATPGRYVMLEVSDNGAGMDAETKSRIFEPFFTTKEPGLGTGLGLATVYGIVRQMGGIIRVESEPGRGATFRLYFPETAERAEPVTLRPAEILSGHESILLVEDDESVRTFVRQVLKQHGYAVLEAHDLMSALATVHAHTGPIDLIVTDVLMPRGTGPELVRALAQVLPKIPALFISGYADAALARQVTFPKASHFLQKPFSAADLLARIRQILSSTA